MSIDDLNGTFDSAALSRLMWPIAWSGPADDDYLVELNGLVEEAREALCSYEDAVSVEIKAGAVVCVNLS